MNILDKPELIDPVLSCLNEERRRNGQAPMTRAEYIASLRKRNAVDAEPDVKPSGNTGELPPRPWGAVAVLSSLAVIAMALSVALGGWPMAVLIGFMAFAVLGSLVFIIAKDGESGVRL